MLHDSSCDLPFLRVASSAFMNMMVSSPEHKPIAASNVWRLQREHAHMAWLKIFGDEPLPQLGSAAEWTQYVSSERHRAVTSMEQRVSDELRLCPHMPPPVTRETSAPGERTRDASLSRACAEPAASVADVSRPKPEPSQPGWCAAHWVRMQEMQQGSEVAEHESSFNKHSPACSYSPASNSENRLGAAAAMSPLQTSSAAIHHCDAKSLPHAMLSSAAATSEPDSHGEIARGWSASHRAERPPPRC